jgi:LL-diaminopimelate aminotransferase
LKLSNRLTKVPVYIFSRIDKIKNDLIKKGIDIIDLGVGDPDIPTPDFIVDSLKESIYNAKNHRYPPYAGVTEFKMAVADYYKRNFNVDLDYNYEVAALIGSKEGIAHFFLSMTDPGDYVIIPDPGYPVYHSAAVISGCVPYTMMLNEANNYIPVLNNIYPEVLRKAKLLIVNYPNNPTGAVATTDFYNKLVKLCADNDIVIANDGAYMEYYGTDNSKLSILQADDAIKNCVNLVHYQSRII